MLGGSVVVESVFSLPGLGRLAYESVVQRDLNTLLGIVFVSRPARHPGQFRRRPPLCAARSAHRGGGLTMDAFKRYFRSPAAVIGLVLLLVVIAMARQRRLALSARSAGARRPAADLAVRQSALPARHRQFRPRHRRADLPRRADLAADRRRRHRDRDPDRHPGRRVRRLLWRLGRRRADADHRGVPDRCRTSCCCWCWSRCSARP